MGSELSGLDWRKAQRSVNNGQCVEVTQTGDMIAIRDSKDPTGPVLIYGPAEFRAFLDDVKRDERGAQRFHRAAVTRCPP